MHHLHQTEFLNKNQYGFAPQKNTTDAAMEARKFIEPHLEKGRVVIMVSLDVRGASDSAWWPAILKGLRYAKCPRNLYNLTLDYLKERKAVINKNNFNIEKRITKGCPQGSCCGPGLWNIQYNPTLNIRYTNTKVIAFADDVVLTVEAESIGEAGNFANIELNKIAQWATDSKMK
jgi:retron-type reverse transcriptase